MRTSIKSLVGIGTEFIENGNKSVVTRVTDLVFDTLDTQTGDIKVRNLGVWERDRFMNSISGVTNLLKIRVQKRKLVPSL